MPEVTFDATALLAAHHRALNAVEAEASALPAMTATGMSKLSGPQPTDASPALPVAGYPARRLVLENGSYRVADHDE